MIKQKFHEFKLEADKMPSLKVREFFRRENPNDLITFLENEPYFKENFPWNEHLNEKHILYMLEQKIPIQWFTLSMSEDIPFQFIQETWRKTLPYQEGKDVRDQLFYNWRGPILAEREDLTLEMGVWLLKRTTNWTYTYNKVHQAGRYKKPVNHYSPRMMQVHYELMYRPPYLEGVDKPCFRFLNNQTFDHIREDFQSRIIY